MLPYKRKKDEDRHEGYKTRLDFVMSKIREKALFWDKTSVSIFLTVFAMFGLFLVIIASMALSDGRPPFQSFLRGMDRSQGWNYTIICLSIVSFGINLIAPLPLFWLVKTKLFIQITISFFLFNVLLFAYAAIVYLVTTEMRSFG